MNWIRRWEPRCYPCCKYWKKREIHLDFRTVVHWGDGIFELRCKFGSDITRTLYFFYEGATIVLTNGFVKKTQKTPPAEIQLAKDRRKDYIRRKEETK